MSLDYLMVQIAIVVGLNEAVKQILLTDAQRKWIPFISVAMGVLVCLLLFPFDSIQMGVRDGIISGLSAVGLFSVAKNVLTIKEGK